MPTPPTARQLAPAVLRTGSPVLFALGGPVVAEALVTGTWRTDGDVTELIGAMVQRLPEVLNGVATHRHPSLLVDVAVALAVLAVVRPDVDREVRPALFDLVRRAPPAESGASSEHLRIRALLAIADDQDPVARRIVEALDARGDVLGAMLGRWAAGQRRREVVVDRLEGLRTLARRFETFTEPRLLVLAAFTLPEPIRTVDRVAPRRRFRPARH